MRLCKPIGIDRPGVGRRVTLYLPFYNEGHPIRRAELIDTFERNYRSELFGHFEVMTDSTPNFDFNRPLVTVTNLGRRQLFADFIRHANEHHPGEIVVMANADIYFDNSLNLVHATDLNNTLLALSRVEPNGELMPQHSQDVWIFSPPLPKFHCKFPFGKPACDNVFAGEAKHAGIRVINPCLSIRVHHNHDSGKRNYSFSNPTDWVIGRKFEPPHDELKLLPNRL